MLVMTEEVKLPDQVLLAFAPLHRSALGVATGVIGGGGLFIMTMILVAKGGYRIGPTLGLLANFFYGYTVTFPGAWIGLAWGFAAGFVFGWGVAFVHNAVIWAWLVIVRSRAEMDQYGDFLDHM